MTHDNNETNSENPSNITKNTENNNDQPLQHKNSNSKNNNKKTNSKNVLQVHENLTEDDLMFVDIEQLLSDEATTFGAVDHRKPPVKPIPMPIPYGDKLYELQYQEYLSHKEEYDRVQLEKDTDKTLISQMEINEFDRDMPLMTRVWDPTIDMISTAKHCVHQTFERSHEEKHDVAVAASEELHDAAVVASSQDINSANTQDTKSLPITDQVEPVTEHTDLISEVADDEDENPFAQFDPKTPSSVFGFGNSTQHEQQKQQSSLSSSSSASSEPHINKHMIPIYPYYSLRQPREQVRERMIHPAFPIAPYKDAPVNCNPNLTAEEMNAQLSNIASDPANKILSPLTITMMQQTALMTLPPHAIEKFMELGLATATGSYLGGAAIGAMFGMFFGSMGMFTPGSGVDTQKTTMSMMKETFRQLWQTTASQSKFFAKMSFLFAGSEYIIAWLRTRHDPWNPILSGCFTGYVIATSNSITKKAGSCAAFAAFSAVIEYVDFMELMTGE